MQKISGIVLFALISINVTYTQIKDIGLPFIRNYSKTEYKAGSQTWDMVQDNRGIMYFANNDGILEFDGVNWKLFRIRNQSVVRSVAIGDDQTIYAGAYNEFGYLKRTSNGNFTYNSLTDLIPAEYRNFDEIWEIYQTTFGIVFQSFKFIFIYKNGKITTLKPLSGFGFSFFINGVYYVVDKEKGILFFEDGNLKSFLNKPDIFRDDEIRFLLPYNNNALLVGILNHGLFILENGEIRSWDSPVNKYILRDHIFSGIQVHSNYYVFGTIRDGFFITDSKGSILQHINRDKGLQNNTILSLFTDKSGNIWSGLDNGISYTEISSPVTILNHCYGIETGYVSLVHDNKLYLGTNQGLFVKELSQLPNNPDKDNSFTLIGGSQGQVWTLYSVGKTLLCGHNNGTFIINDKRASKISSVRGVWKFLQRKNHMDEIIAGTYTGLIVFRKISDKNGDWSYSHNIRGFSESSKDIIEDIDGSLLISHGYKGIYRVHLNENADSAISTILYTQTSGLPERLPYEIHSILGETLVTTADGCYQYNSKEGKFTKSVRFNSIFNNEGIFKLFTDSASNIWYTATNRMGVFRLMEDGNYREVTTPFYRFSDNLVPAFEHIYPYDEHNVFIGVQDGFIHYDPSIIKRYNDSYPIFIREVKFLKKYPDSVITHVGNLQHNKNETFSDIVIPYSANSIAFSYAAPYYEDPDKTKYRCRLKGYSDEWSPWEIRTMREYTNLHEGKYTFEVQARNIYKTLSTIDSFDFEVAPPFHRSVLAYIIYAFLIISIIIANIIYFMRRIERTRQKEKILHERKMLAKEQQFREESLISEKEIEHLKNERLLSEMKHKNKELANSTMHIIQKNKFLNTIKEELYDITSTFSNDGNKSRIRQLQRKIDRDISNEKYFKVFDSYFDDVHQDFLKRLKEKHPELSPKELRLCAYIRMNISSKEIASLLNITIRGVEVSRYRLRKKMGLEREINLTEYILNL